MHSTSRRETCPGSSLCPLRQEGKVQYLFRPCVLVLSAISSFFVFIFLFLSLLLIFRGSMRLPKIYGQSSISQCPFCGGQAYTKNAQGIPCCSKHAHITMPDVKCACGGWLDQRESKFGVFYTCIKCGPFSFNKMLAVNGDVLRNAVDAPGNPVVFNSQASKNDLTTKLRVQEKMRRGEPLTQAELEYL